MNRRFVLQFLFAVTWVWPFGGMRLSLAAEPAGVARRPNIVFILADDLGYGDLGCYGQERIKTPHLDRLAADGIRFTSCYAGSTVCALSRCAPMTGLHMGHARIRGNGLLPLRPEDVTVAEVLQSAGYATGIVGKWGLGEAETTGVPNLQGFQTWFGFLNQVHAHNYYPDFLWRNQERYLLPGNVVERGVATQRSVYAPDLFTEEALEFLESHQKEPFFLYLTYTLPHANNEAGQEGMEVPSEGPYGNEPWPQAQRNHAAMITYLDAAVGRVLARLEELGLAEETVVFFSSDNGPHKEGGADPAFFQSAGPLRGWKRDLYEGGIRVPGIVRWKGRIEAGRTSDRPWAFWDFLATAAELAGAEATPSDGISIVPELLGMAPDGGARAGHEYLYWEFFERGFQQAVRLGKWKGLRLKAVGGQLELYDLAADLGETSDVAAAHPEVVERIEEIMRTARTESADWPVRKAD